MQELFFSTLEGLIVQPNLPVDERRKRAFLFLFLLTVIPSLFSFALWHFVTAGLTYRFFLIMLAVLVGSVNVVVLRYAQYPVASYRIGVLIILSLLTYLLITGDAYGVSYVWFFFHPVAAFFLFGSREGLFWVALSWVICVLTTVANLGTYQYEVAIGLRFVVSYTLVSILAYGLEASRKHYYDQLAAEKVALEVALQQVKTLQSLLPICASCKKIRDDGGYWHQVESYMRDHAGIEFSHSICPDCRVRLYPPTYKAATISTPSP